MFINMDLGGTVEPKPVAAGRYDLTIARAEYREDKGDIDVSIGIDGHESDAPNIRHFISLPKPDDDAGKVGFKKLFLKRFLVQFSIPYDEASGFNIEDLAGSRANVQVTLTEPDANGAVYNRLNLDRLPSE